MSSSERKNSAAPPAGVDHPAGVETRLASLEDEATRLRAEIAELQDEIRWLAADEEEWSGDPAWLSRGWLYRGWVRASLLLLVVGVITLVSVPYFLHLGDSPDSPSASTDLSAAAPAPVPTAAAPVPHPEYIPAPARLGSSEIPAPTRITSPGERRARPIAPTGAEAKRPESP